MAKSHLLQVLEREIARLAIQFLPAVLSDTGDYDNLELVQAHARAFIVLSHAEIESYLEQWSKRISRRTEIAWTSSGRVTRPLLFLVSTYGERLRVTENASTPGGLDSSARFSANATKVFQKHYESIADNHGIKETNVWSLFAPIGLGQAQVGSTLLQNLSSFGALRGDNAHTSAKAITYVADPRAERDRLEKLLIDLTVLDTTLVAYEKSIR